MSRVKSIKQVTNHPFLNYYELEAENRAGKTFPYYMASRAKTQADLKMQEADPAKDRPDGVAIYSLYGEKRDRVVLIRQYRYPLGGYIYELPAGLVEPGEDFHAGAVREMKEETGLTFTPMQVAPMFERPFYTTIGMTDECCSMVFGTSRGEVSRDFLEETEDLEIVLADRTEVRRILEKERVAVMCAYMLMHFLAAEGDPFAFLAQK